MNFKLHLLDSMIVLTSLILVMVDLVVDTIYVHSIFIGDTQIWMVVSIHLMGINIHWK
jgi:hypothetical protein